MMTPDALVKNSSIHRYIDKEFFIIREDNKRNLSRRLDNKNEAEN